MDNNMALNINVNVSLHVEEDTVQTCLKVVEIWLNEDVTHAIHGGYRHEDGKVDPLVICRSNVASK